LYRMSLTSSSVKRPGLKIAPCNIPSAHVAIMRLMRAQRSKISSCINYTCLQCPKSHRRFSKEPMTWFPNTFPAGDKANTQQKKPIPAKFEDSYLSLAQSLDKKIYLVIDALDECDDIKESHFLETLQDMPTNPNYPEVRFHVILCSHPEEMWWTALQVNRSSKWKSIMGQT